MKKVVLASFVACAAIASGLPIASAQDTAAPPAAAPAAAANSCSAPAQMAAPEYAIYNNAMTQTTPQAKAAGYEQYLTQFPQSSVKETTLETIMVLDYSIDQAKALDAADRLLQVNPSNLKGLFVETLVRTAQVGNLDPTAKPAAMDTVAGYAQKGLNAPKPACMSDADFATLKAGQYPTFYSAIGYDALLKKDSAGAIDAYKKELAIVPEPATKTPGPVLQDIYYLGEAYRGATPPDYLSCAFYESRAIAYAPDNYKTILAPTQKYCYKKYHGGDDGIDAVLAAATANLNPPADFATTIKPAPTPAERIHTIIASTPDLGTLAIDDKETIFQNGSPEDAAKVWDTVKGKSVALPGAMVIESSPDTLKVAVSSDAVQSKTADFTFKMKAPEELPAGSTPAAKAAFTKNQAAIVAATAVGQIVTLQGTYDSYTPNPIMITMANGEVVLAKGAKTTAKPAAKPAGHAAPHAGHKAAH